MEKKGISGIENIACPVHLSKLTTVKSWKMAFQSWSTQKEIV
jgi:hypothetical protein